MPFWSGRRRSKEYVPPAESRARTIVVFDGTAWQLAPFNVADGSVPATLPAIPELTGEALAEAFRSGWRRALDGAASGLASEINLWISAIEGQPVAESERPAAWNQFFARGGAVFRLAPQPASEAEPGRPGRGGIHAERFGWGWPLTGNPPVWRSDKDADNLDVEPDAAWRDAIDGGSPRWQTAAAWMRDRALADARVAAWWIADPDGAPRTAVMTELDAVTNLNIWWKGETHPTGSRAIQRYALPEPGGDSIWSAWLRWDPAGSPRPDGLADVLAMRRLGKGVDLVWWSVRPDGGFARPVHAVAELDVVEQVVSRMLVLERRPPDVEWTEVDAR